MTIVATLCYLRKDGQVLLIEKARGFGQGKLNAPGGRVQPDEAPEDGAKREVYEETGLTVNTLTEHGVLYFFFGQDTKPDWIVHVYSSASFSGTLRAGEEGRLHWIDERQLPYDLMWPDDEHWVPHLLQNERFTGRFYFDAPATRLLRFELHVRDPVNE